MSLELIRDQEVLYKNADELITRFESQDKNFDFELIQVTIKKTPEQIRKAYLRSNIEPLEKAMEKGPDYVRKYFNDKNLRRRKNA